MLSSPMLVKERLLSPASLTSLQKSWHKHGMGTFCVNTYDLHQFLFLVLFKAKNSSAPFGFIFVFYRLRHVVTHTLIPMRGHSR
jgi:hypothetical protein